MKRKVIGIISSAALAIPVAAFAGASHISAKEQQNTAATAAQPAAATAATLRDAAQQAGSFNTWLRAVETAGLSDLIAGAGNYTVFAPTDTAFGKLPKEQLDALLKDPAKLKGVLKNHMLSQKYSATDMPLQGIYAMGGKKLTLSAHRSHALSVAGANVVAPNIVATNGIIHGIDQVILN